jgi:hypothetical protein
MDKAEVIKSLQAMHGSDLIDVLRQVFPTRTEVEKEENIAANLRAEKSVLTYGLSNSTNLKKLDQSKDDAYLVVSILAQISRRADCTHQE